MSDYEVTIKVRNGRIKAAMRKAGYESVAELCRATDNRETEVGKIVNMKISPIDSRTGMWRKVVFDISSALHCEPEDLFTERQMQGFNNTEMCRIVSEEQALAIGAEGGAEGTILCKEVVSHLEENFNTRNVDIFKSRFGLNGDPEMTLVEIGEKHDLTKESIRRIESMMLRYLKRPTTKRLFEGCEER